MAGTMLVRSQGALALAQVKTSLETLRDPSEPLAHGAMILFSGALLLTPGFFTDAVGFALLVPGVRNFVFREVKKRIEIRRVAPRHPHGAPRPADDVIDASYTVQDDADHPRGPSGWTKP